jgi:hypothetical protein
VKRAEKNQSENGRKAMRRSRWRLLLRITTDPLSLLVFAKRIPLSMYTFAG